MRLHPAVTAILLSAASAAPSPCALAGPPLGDDPFADAVINYAPGSAGAPFNQPGAALGSPARNTGGEIIPSTVTPFQPAWMPEELVSVGTGGELVLWFATPVTDDPANPFGIDLLIFGNAFFSDAAAPAGLIAGLFSEGGTIEVSSDGTVWSLIPGIEVDGLFPTLGWSDIGPYDIDPGLEPTDFTLPVDPSVALDDLIGLNWTALLNLYNGSGGGAGIDLASVGLTSVSYVRLRSTGGVMEIDAVSDVSPAAPPPVPEDIDGNGSVGFSDLILLLGAWGPCPARCPEDLDADGTVGFSDLVALLAAWD